MRTLTVAALAIVGLAAACGEDKPKPLTTYPPEGMAPGSRPHDTVTPEFNASLCNSLFDIKARIAVEAKDPWKLTVKAEELGKPQVYRCYFAWPAEGAPKGTAEATFDCSVEGSTDEAIEKRVAGTSEATEVAGNPAHVVKGEDADQYWFVDEFGGRPCGVVTSTTLEARDKGLAFAAFARGLVSKIP